MKDDDIAKEALRKGELLQPKKTDPAVNFLGELVDLLPIAYQDTVINIALVLIGIIWIVDMVTIDPLPFLDEAGLTYLLYLLWRLKQSKKSST